MWHVHRCGNATVCFLQYDFPSAVKSWIWSMPVSSLFFDQYGFPGGHRTHFQILLQGVICTADDHLRKVTSFHILVISLIAPHICCLLQVQRLVVWLHQLQACCTQLIHWYSTPHGSCFQCLSRLVTFVVYLSCNWCFHNKLKRIVSVSMFSSINTSMSRSPSRSTSGGIEATLTCEGSPIKRKGCK